MSQHPDNIVMVELDNAAFLPHVVELVAQGHTVTLPLRGNSMRPFLKDGRDKAVLVAPHCPKVGDVVLAEIGRGHYVLHRIVGLDQQRVTLRGDGNRGNEYCTLDNIKAKAEAFLRKGRKKADSTNGRKWLIYSWWWTRLYPVRRYLLFLLHPHVPARLRPRQKRQDTALPKK